MRIIFMKSIILVLITPFVMSAIEADAATKEKIFLGRKPLRTVSQKASESNVAKLSSDVRAEIEKGKIPASFIPKSDMLKQEASCPIPGAKLKSQTRAQSAVETCYWVGQTHSVSQTQNELLAGVVYEYEVTNNCSLDISYTTITILDKPEDLSVIIDPNFLDSIPPGGKAYFKIGIASYSRFEPGEYIVKYRYAGDATPGISTLKITVTESPSSPLVIHYLERNRGAKDQENPEAVDRGLIAKIVPNPLGDGYFYYDAFGDPVTEESVAGIDAYKFYKHGLTADGNTRFLVRVQSDIPGGIFFALDTNALGFRFETLDGRILTEEPLDWWGNYTTEIAEGVHQMTVVLVAPTGFRSEYSFPKHEFRIGILQSDMEGNIYEDTEVSATLELWNNPVIMLHGLWGDYGTFSKEIERANGTDLKTPYSLLREELIPGTVSEYRYDGLQGPSFSMFPLDDGLYRKIDDMIHKYVWDGIACTQVDLLAHSMGGLMSRKFIYDNIYYHKSYIGYRNGLVRRVITVATPHFGSAFANLLLGSFVRYPNTEVGEWLQLHSAKIAPILANISRKKFNGYFLNPYCREPEENTVFNSAIRDLAEGSNLIAALEYYSFPSVPMQGIAGDAQLPLRKLMNTTVISRKIGDWNIGRLIRALAWMIPEPQETIPDEPTQPTTAELLKAIGQTMPPEARIFDLLELLDKIFPSKKSDLVVDNMSSKWRFSDAKHTIYDGSAMKDIVNMSHIGITKQADVADKILSLIKGPVEIFDTFESDDSDSFSASNALYAANLKFHDRSTGTPKTIITDIPPSPSIEPVEDIPAIVLRLDKVNVAADEVIELSGVVSQDVADLDDPVLEVSLKSKHALYAREGYWLNIKADKTFRQLIRLPNPGAYEVFATVDDFHGRRVLYTSNKIDILVRPDVANAVSLAFYGESVFSEGESVAIGLVAVDSSQRKWDVSSPLTGTQYRVVDPAIAIVQDDGTILGLNPGTTFLHASFGGKEIFKKILVRSSSREVPDFVRELMLRKPTPPVPIEPESGVSVTVNSTITFRVSPFDTLQGNVFHSSSWTIKNEETGMDIATLTDGTAEYATWTPSEPGAYSWSMGYVYDNGIGSTPKTPERTFTVTN